MGVLNKKLIRDAAGSPIPQIFDVEQGIFIAATNGTGDASNVNFSKIKMIRDALGSPIPQYFDVTQNKFVAKTSEGGGGGSGSTAWSDITGKPSSYPPSAHTHEIAEVNGLQGALTAKANGEDLTSLEQTVTTHLDNNVKHINYAVASGTNNYIVSITGIESFVEGLSIKVKFTNGNTAASTLNVNGLGAKDLVKSNGSALANGNIKAGQILHLVYTGINFQLLGEGGEYGNAVAADVLSGKTIGTEDGVVSGTMPNRGAVNQNLAANGSYTIPEGYHNGSGKVTQSLTTKSAETITPGTSNKTIAANQYLTGVQTILGDADLIAANIKQGVNIFGVTGTLNLASLGGTKFASGTVNLSSEPLSFRTYDGNNLPSFYHIQVSGLSFKPRMIVAVYVSGAAKHQAIYNNMTGQDGVSTSVHHNNSSQPQNNYLKANDNSGYVTSTSFRLPIVSTSNISSPNSGVVRWYAYE